MDTDAKKVPWYIAGLAFQCQSCGRCCAGPEEGYVWATEDEIAAIAEHLNITLEQMQKQHVRKVRRRYCLREDKRTTDCIFLCPDQGQGRRCAVYPVRPRQCRTWPFWPSNLRSLNAWNLAGTRCKGINRGCCIPADRIEAMVNATRE